MTDVAASVARVRERIEAAARRSGRRPEEITLVAVTKGVDLPQIEQVVACGITDLGESRVQEALPKVAALAAGLRGAGIDRIVVRPGSPPVRWHMVGHLQRNKVRQAAVVFSVVHSVDSVRLATELSHRTEGALDVLLQVNVAGEAQKFGVPPDAVPSVLQEMARLPRLRIIGLMTIVNDPQQARPVFRRLRLLRDEVNPQRIGEVMLAHLSMGMTDDFEVAVEEGATMVRIGRAIFGGRT